MRTSTLARIIVSVRHKRKAAIGGDWARAASRIIHPIAGPQLSGQLLRPHSQQHVKTLASVAESCLVLSCR